MAAALDKRTRRTHAPNSGSRAPRAVKLARRAEACGRILELLAAGPLSAIEIAAAVGLIPSTAYAHLRYMAIDLRSVRRTGQVDALRRETWELGEDLQLPTREEMQEASFAQHQRIVPAKQVGMWRDRLVAALFGAPTSGAVP